MVHTLRLDNYYPTPRKLVLGTNSSFGTESIKIERGAGWDGLNLTATWHIPGREEPLRVALLDGDAMDVPPEVTKEAKDGVLVLAGLASGVQRASCNVEYLILEQAGVYGGVDAEPTPELAAQVLEAALQAKADAEAAAEDAAAAKANADKAQADAKKAQQAAENAAADAAKAGPYAEAARAAQEAAESAQNGAIAAQQAAENAAAAAAASKSAADTLAAEAARAAQAAENSKAAANNAADLAGENAAAAQQAAATATAAANDAGQIASNAAASKAAAETAAKAAQDAQTAAAEAKAEAVKAQVAAQTAAKSAQDAQAAAEKARDEAKAARKGAEAARDAAANSAAAAKTSEDAAAKSAKAATFAAGTAYYGVDFTGSTSAGTRTGAAAEFVFTPGTDTSAGQNDFDGVYPWAGMRRCCCTLNADGTVTVNAYKGQPGYIEDGTNGEVLVEVPLFYVSGMLDVNPRVSAVPMPGFRAPKKFQNADGSLKQKCYLPAFPGSIGADGKLHSIAGVVSTGDKNISQFLAAARLWGETYCINTSADFEVLAYLMIVVYGTRSTQEKIRGVSTLYTTNVAVTGARTSEAAVTVGKNVLEVGMVISIGTGGEDESVADRRIVTAIEAIEGDTANVKASFTGEAVTTTTDHKIWRIMQSTGTANSVISTCGSPVSNSDGRHSFVFYGVENPLYGNQWRFECDWKIVDGVPYICNDTNYNWSSVENYTKLDSLTLPNEGWAKSLQADERFPWLQITKEVGGSSGIYLADYFWIDKNGSHIVLRGAYSYSSGGAGAFAVDLRYATTLLWWRCSADLSIPG
nr:MAG TPA: tail collar fiber protein [Caudoviricetes sp.]